MINAGGLINVADELRGYDRERAIGRVEAIYRTLRAVFRIAQEEDVPTNEAADRFALARIERITRLRRYWVPGRSSAGPRAVW